MSICVIVLLKFRAKMFISKAREFKIELNQSKSCIKTARIQI